MLKYISTLLLLFLFGTAESVYILRYGPVTENGGILFTGNTIGLSKQFNQNQPGKEDSIGAFITDDLSSQVGYYNPGTTLVWQENNSDAYLDLPAGSTVLYAELIWSGSYGFQNQITGNEPNTPVTLTTPVGTHSVAPDPSTAQVALTPGFTNAGNYVRSQNVTSYVQAGGAGLYKVGGIPATIGALDNTHNAGGWTLAVAFRNGAMPTSSLTIFVGCEQASSGTSAPAAVSGFCTPSEGPLSGSLYISAIEGDANKMGDRMLFGPTLPLTIGANSLSGGNNPINNFFCSQINTLLPFSGSTFVQPGQLDTRGSFGNFNADPVSGVILPGSRQGYDITSVDISGQLTFNQNTAYAKGTTTGDDYTINALAMQIQINAPFLVVTKQVNKAESVFADVGDVLTFSFTITNTGLVSANNVVFFDLMPVGLQYNDNLMVSVPFIGDPTTGIIFTNSLAPGQTATISFQVEVIDYPEFGNTIVNTADVNYRFSPCGQGRPQQFTATSNEVEITLPNPPPPFPTLSAVKEVNGSDEIVSSVGEVVTFTITLSNSGNGDAIDVVLSDQLENGLVLVPGSILVDEVVLDPQPPLTAIPVGTVPEGGSVVVLFQATITDYPNSGLLYFNGASVAYDYLNGDTPQPLSPVESNEVTINLYVQPIGFQGILRVCHWLNETRYCVDTDWIVPFSYNPLFYRIYSGSYLIADNIPVDVTSRTFCFSSLKSVKNLSIAAVYEGGVESEHYAIRILNE